MSLITIRSIHNFYFILAAQRLAVGFIDWLGLLAAPASLPLPGDRAVA